MTQKLEFINGHWYMVYRDVDGNIIAMDSRDPVTPQQADSTTQRVEQLLKASSLTAAEQQELMKAIAKKVYGR